jgi:putative ABC transport system permease protein
LDTEATPQLYRCVWQVNGLAMALVVRSRAADAASLAAAVQQDVRAVDGELPLYAVRPMSTVVAEATARRRFSMVLLGLFAGAALLLSAVGIYAMMAYVVRQRAYEIGIRLALGARPADAVRLIFQRGLRLTAAGALLGLAGAFVLTRALGGAIFGVPASDPVSFVGPPLILSAVSLAACYFPARKAASVDPIRTLKAE